MYKIQQPQIFKIQVKKKFKFYHGEKKIKKIASVKTKKLKRDKLKAIFQLNNKNS
jgi:hypothetical protein